MLSKNQIKEIQSLHTKKFRDQHQQFIIEGIKSVMEVLESKATIIEQLIGTEDFIYPLKQKLIAAGINHTTVTDDILKKISLQNKPNKVLAVCKYFELENKHIDFDKNFTFYLDDIRDPGNFGTIVRLANWFGIDTIYCSPTSCDKYNPKVIQSSMGAFIRVKVVYSELSDLVKDTTGINVYGALLHGENIYGQKLKNGLIVIGNEANGISDDNQRFITTSLTIPSAQNNGTESLNAAMAASIIASEFFRQLSH
ncbi:MAG: RNA methyltransferase [Bacteroidia bacterium]|nr:RNA methyltransferase [Bacteroidia bacterium]